VLGDDSRNPQLKLRTPQFAWPFPPLTPATGPRKSCPSRKPARLCSVRADSAHHHVHHRSFLFHPFHLQSPAAVATCHVEKHQNGAGFDLGAEVVAATMRSMAAACQLCFIHHASMPVLTLSPVLKPESKTCGCCSLPFAPPPLPLLFFPPPTTPRGPLPVDPPLCDAVDEDEDEAAAF